MLIAYERGTVNAAQYDDDDIAIGAITLAEFRVGIELADTAERAAARSAKLAALEEQVEVLEYTPGTAAAHARLIAHAKRSGRPRSADDLIIAAHAAESGRKLVSTDSAARFGDLPGVEAQDPA